MRCRLYSRLFMEVLPTRRMGKTLNFRAQLEIQAHRTVHYIQTAALCSSAFWIDPSILNRPVRIEKKNIIGLLIIIKSTIIILLPHLFQINLTKLILSSDQIQKKRDCKCHSNHQCRVSKDHSTYILSVFCKIVKDQHTVQLVSTQLSKYLYYNKNDLMTYHSRCIKYWTELN